MIDSVIQQLKERNVADGTAVSFESFKDSFVFVQFNLDEEGWQASGSTVKIAESSSAHLLIQVSSPVVGAASLTKHERETLGRTSITLLKCGNAHGDWAPRWYSPRQRALVCTSCTDRCSSLQG
jgi:hypothetical protein